MFGTLEKIKLFNSDKKLIVIEKDGKFREVKLYESDAVVFKVNADEILIAPVDFDCAVSQNKFVEVKTDENDWFKRIGITADNDIYVAEWMDADIPDDKWDEYKQRCGSNAFMDKILSK